MSSNICKIIINRTYCEIIIYIDIIVLYDILINCSLLQFYDDLYFRNYIRAYQINSINIHIYKIYKHLNDEQFD